MEAARDAGITLGRAVPGDRHAGLLACERAGDPQPLFFQYEECDGGSLLQRLGPGAHPSSTGFMKCAFLPKGSWLITSPSAVDNSSVCMVVTEESSLQPVAGKFRATQGWLGRRAGFIDGPGSWRLCGRNLVNGSLGPLPPASAMSPFFSSFFLSFGVNVGKINFRKCSRREGCRADPGPSQSFPFAEPLRELPHPQWCVLRCQRPPQKMSRAS